MNAHQQHRKHYARLCLAGRESCPSLRETPSISCCVLRLHKCFVLPLSRGTTTRDMWLGSSGILSPGVWWPCGCKRAFTSYLANWKRDLFSGTRHVSTLCPVQRSKKCASQRAMHKHFVSRSCMLGVFSISLRGANSASNMVGMLVPQCSIGFPAARVNSIKT